MDGSQWHDPSLLDLAVLLLLLPLERELLESHGQQAACKEEEEEESVLEGGFTRVESNQSREKEEE